MDGLKPSTNKLFKLNKPIPVNKNENSFLATVSTLFFIFVDEMNLSSYISTASLSMLTNIDEVDKGEE